MTDLVDLIYETAVSPENWPALLEAIDEHTRNGEPLAVHEENDFFRHFQRAVSIASRLAEQEDQAQLLDASLDQMPFATLLVDENADIIAMNRVARALGDRQRLITFEGNRISAQSAKTKTRLADLITADTPSKNPKASLTVQDATLSLSVMVLDIKLDEAVHYQNVKLVLIAEAGQEPRVSRQYLQEHYGLTKAEARLASDFIAGGALRGLADRYHVSYHTVRTQMKRVLAKSGVQRQSELVQKVLSGPLALIAPAHTVEAHRDFRAFTLNDGRQMAWAEYGPSDGRPVILCHSSIWSRRQRHPDNSILARNKVRLIVPDRPGYGRSDPLADRNLYDWPEDLSQLADHLNLGRFGLMGIMLGADYALSAASALPNRVYSTALLSARISPKLCPGYKASSVIIGLLEKLSVESPALVEASVRLIFRDVLRRPERYVTRVLGKPGIKDQAVWEDGTLQEIFTEAFRESNRQGVGKAFIEDWNVLTRSDAYDLSTVQTPVSIWHGTREKFTSVECMRQAADRLPNATLHIIDDGNLHTFWHHWGDAIEYLAGV